MREDLFRNIVTFGAYHRVQKKSDDLGRIKEELCEVHGRVEKTKIIVNKKLLKLIKAKKKALLSLKKINKIAKNIRGKYRDVQEGCLEEQHLEVDLQNIHDVISLGETALNASVGVASGVSTALGAWGLVSTFGAASTGTAISALSGVAATNATLAWFGGGAVTAGGGGMAAGSVVLGGIVVIPALVIMGLFSHLSANKKIKEITEVILEIRRAIDNQKQCQLMVDLIGRRSDELRVSIRETRRAFLHEYRKTYISVYPFFFFSKLFKYIRKRYLDKNYYNRKDLNKIYHLVNVASEFSKLIDQKIMDEEGRLI